VSINGPVLNIFTPPAAEPLARLLLARPIYGEVFSGRLHEGDLLAQAAKNQGRPTDTSRTPLDFTFVLLRGLSIVISKGFF
jgi:hypothetical protein